MLGILVLRRDLQQLQSQLGIGAATAIKHFLFLLVAKLNCSLSGGRVANARQATDPLADNLRRYLHFRERLLEFYGGILPLILHLDPPKDQLNKKIIDQTID